MLIVDEVITGFGRTGRWFGCGTYGVRPDIVSPAKGLTSALPYLPVMSISLPLCIAKPEIIEGAIRYARAPDAAMPELDALRG